MHEDILFPYSRVCEAPARVLLTGDQALIRTALRLLISSGGMTIVGECSNDPDALRAAMHSVDLVVMDLDLDTHWSTRPENLGPLFGAAQGVPVLIVTRSGDGRGVSSALEQGALGIVLKDRPADVLMHAIRAVLAGELWLERSMVTSFFRSGTATCALYRVPERLTRRESQVVELVSLGLSNKKIAERLSIAENTVRHHLTSIFDKLAVTNRLELMRYAWNTAPANQ